MIGRRPLVPALVVAAATAGGAPATAAPAVEHLTVAEAVARARAHSPALAALGALAEAARADERAAHAARLPQVDAGAGYTRRSNVPELSLVFPGQEPLTIFPNLPNSYRTGLSAAVPLYTGGRLGAAAEAAAGEEHAATLDVDTGSADLELETTTAYWALVTARETERLLRESLGAYDAHLADARNRETVGLAARNEVLAVQVERDRAELARLRATSVADVAETNLIRLVGLAPGTRVEPDEPLAAVEGPPATADEDVEALVGAAIAQRPDRAALVARVGAAQAAVRIEKAARLPQVSAAAGIDYANPNPRILPPVDRWHETWDVGLSVGWTVFDGGRAGAAVGRAAARAEALQHQLEDLDAHVRLQVTDRRSRLQTDRIALEVAQRNVTAARENARVATERHRAGLIPSSERLDAEVALMRAEVDQAEALAALRIGQAALDRALGR